MLLWTTHLQHNGQQPEKFIYAKTVLKLRQFVIMCYTLKSTDRLLRHSYRRHSNFVDLPLVAHYADR